MTTLEMLDTLRRLSPEMTIGGFVALLDQQVIHAECLHCQQPIRRLPITGSEPWFHGDFPPSRGCRTASYRSDGGGWNDELDRKWKATPKPE